MKKVFLEELKKALEEAKVKNASEIVALYEKRFDLGYEAGMTDKEIIEMLDSIEDIVAQSQSDNINDKKEYNIKLDLSLFTAFNIAFSKKNGISFDIDEAALNDIEIINKENLIELKSRKIIKNRSRYAGTMYFGPNVRFKDFVINNIDSDIKCCDITCDKFQLATTSGDVLLGSINVGDSASVSTVNGDIEIKSIIAKYLSLNCISGDFESNDVTCEAVTISTVSGDVKINHTNPASYKINTVSGDVYIEKGADLDKIKASSISGEVTIGGVMQDFGIASQIKNALNNIKF